MSEREETGNQHVPCNLTTLEWARERWANSIRIAQGKTGADLEGWLEDVNYWALIVGSLARLDSLQPITESISNRPQPSLPPSQETP